MIEPKIGNFGAFLEIANKKYAMFLFSMLKKFLPWLLVLVLLVFILLEREKDRFFKEESGKIEVMEDNFNNVVLEEVEGLGKMELVKFKFRDIIKLKKDNLFPLTDDEILLVVTGEAVGCIDFTKIKAEHVNEAGDTLFVDMPEPEICYSKIDHAQSKVYDLTFTQMFDKTELVEEAFKKAEEKIERIAIESNLLEQTRANAELTLKPILERISNKKVVLTFKLSPEYLLFH